MNTLSQQEVQDEARLLDAGYDYCRLCNEYYVDRGQHLSRNTHWNLYFRLPSMQSIREQQWCKVCDCRVTNAYRMHIHGKRHQGNVAAAPPSRNPAQPPAAVPRLSYSSVAGQSAAASGQPIRYAMRPQPAAAAPANTRPARAAAAAASPSSSRRHPASSLPSSSSSSSSSDPDAIVDDNLCQLCRVRVGKGRECSPALITRHQRGRQHKTQRAMAKNEWAGEATIAAWQDKAGAHGLSLLPHVDSQPLQGGQLVLEVGKLCEIDLRVKNTTNKPTRLLGIFVVPPMPFPGFSWRHFRQSVIHANATNLMSTPTVASAAELGSHRTLIVVSFATGHNLALPLNISVVPANSRAEMELLQPSSAYKPKPSHVPTASSTHVRVIEGERPPSKLSAKELYTRKPEPFHIPSWLTAGSERSKGRDPDEVALALNAKLAASNHASRFHLLLWLEEWQMMSDIQMYDAQAAFSKHPDHRGLFGLTVPGLAEARPSVLVGDRILVSEQPFDHAGGQSSGQVFAGVVWRVEQDWVYLRFHDSFLSRWVSGKKFHVRFSFDRVSMRRAHQGVKVPNAQTVQRFFSPAANPSTTSSVPPSNRASAPAPSSSSSSQSLGRRYPFLSSWKITSTDNEEKCNTWMMNEVLTPEINQVGLDLEFGIKDGVETIVLLQIATPTACLIYYPQNVTDADDLPQTLVEFLSEGSGSKFTIGQQDKDMLEGCWGLQTGGVEDLQRDLMHLLQLPLKPGLERMVQAFLPHLGYVKDKAMQRSTFAWPLTAEQKEYAASDAVLALLLGEKLDQLSLPDTKRLWEARVKADALGNLTNGDDELKQPTLPTQPMQAVGGQVPPLRSVTFFNQHLNQPQQDAVRGVCTGLHHPHPYVIFGPPGTGKTTVLVECIRQLLRRNKDGTQTVRILATAPSNSAADLLAERMAAAPVSMTPSAMFRMNAVSRDNRSIPAVLQPFCWNVDGQCALRPRAELLRYELVICTCIAAATLYSLGCEVGDFTHIIVDEAGHATEPEALAAMTGLIDHNRTQVILGGDPLQLGPIIRSPLASKHGLGISLLERLLVDAQSQPQSPYYRGADASFPVLYITKLLHNYRSHPAILQQPNAMFYKNELIASADKLARESLQRWPEFPVANFPILLHHVVGAENREGDSPSWWNSDEAMAVVDYVKKLLAYKAGGVQMADVGIITPYRKQVQKIRQLLSFKFPHSHHLLKVGSVEEYQGQERRVILISTVRSQQLSLDQFDVKYRLGFVNHPKRLNVALTRAKAALIIVGNAQLLRTDPNWRRYVDFLHARGAIRGRFQPEQQESVAGELVKVALEMAEAGVSGQELQKVFQPYLPREEKEEVKSEEKDDDEAEVPPSEELPWRRDD